MNRRIEMREVLDADSEELFALYEVFFDDEHFLKPDYCNGIGFNVMYFARVDVVPVWRGRRIEEALVRRLSDTWGAGCAIAVVPLADDEARWRTIGFQLPEGQSRYAYLDLAVVNPELVAEDEKGNSFRVGPGN